MGVSEELHGITTITVAVIISLTGVLEMLIAEPGLQDLPRFQEPIAKGLALGTSADAVGTSKALELGEVEGATSGLSIAVAGILTVVGASVFAEGPIPQGFHRNKKEPLLKEYFPGMVFSFQH